MLQGKEEAKSVSTAKSAHLLKVTGLDCTLVLENTVQGTPKLCLSLKLAAGFVFMHRVSLRTMYNLSISSAGAKL